MYFERMNFFIAVAVCTVLGCAGSSAPDGQPEAVLSYVLVAEGLSNPVYLTQPGGDDRLFIVEQQGSIRIVSNGQLHATPFLNLEQQVQAGGEQGLLSMAFHPDYASNGSFYVCYTDLNGDTQVERYTVSADPDVADPNSGQTILSVPQPFSNHNGGLLLFGPDGLLYIGLGDGGGANDPMHAAQDRSTLLGSILRIDVDAAFPYAIPAHNPFTGEPNVREEIWVYGVRNPWRFSIDAESGMMWIGDVGQNAWEEVNAISLTEGGANLGWNVMEGANCRIPNCDMTGLTLPVLQYANPTTGCSVIGGYVYRGDAMPSLRGHYFFSDLCGGWLRSVPQDTGMPGDVIDWDVPRVSPFSFGVDNHQELYILTGDGLVYRIVEAGG